MATLTITAKTDLSTLPAKVRRDVTSAYTALAALEPTPARVAKAAQRVGTLRAHGLSVRGVVAILSVEGQGTLPTGKGTIERLGYVADAIAGEWPDLGDDAVGIAHALYKVANIGSAADVKSAADAARKCKSAADAYAAIDKVHQTVRAAQHKSLTTAPTRNPSPPAPQEPSAPQEPAEGAEGAEGQEPAEGAQEPAQEPAPQGVVPRPTGQGVALMGIPTARLITELQRRAEAPGFTAEEVALLDALAAYVEERVAVDADAEVTA